MKLYALSNDSQYIVSFDATFDETDDATKLDLIDMFYENTCKQEVEICISNNSIECIKSEVSKLSYLAPSYVSFDPRTVKCVKLPSTEVVDGETKRYKEEYRITVTVEELPTLYYILFDENNNLRESAIVDLAAYLSYNFDTPGIKSIIEKYKCDECDNNLNYETKYKLIKAFFSMLDIKLDGVERVNNNLDSKVKCVEAIETIREYIKDNSYYDEDDDYDYEAEREKEEKNKSIVRYQLGNSIPALKLGSVTV